MQYEYEHRSGARVSRFWATLLIYAGAGLAAVQALLIAREHFDLPQTIASGFIAVLVGGFLATFMLLKTRFAGGGSPILQALQAVAVILLFAAAGLLIAYWLEPAVPALVAVLV